MQLANYLKRFKNIAWYPSAGKDVMSMISLSWRNLARMGIAKEDMPDCFLFTDYDTYARYENNQRFCLDVEEEGEPASFTYANVEYQATAFNIEELERLHIGLRHDMICGEPDEYYGRVFTADILVDHPEQGKIIAKLVYVVAENTAFAFDFLLRKNIKVKYAIHSRYGNGFGGGASSGAYMFHILKDLGVTYFASDMDEGFDNDAADIYLSEEQKHTFPCLHEICDLGARYHWYGVNATKLYKVVDYCHEIRPIGFFNDRQPRFKIIEY